MRAPFLSRILIQAVAGSLFTAACLSSHATAEEPEHVLKPLLWRIEGQNLQKPSYLFGTIHLGAPEIVNLHPAAQKAFDAADAVYTEVTMDRQERKAVLPLAIRKDGKTLSQSLGKDLSDRFAEELRHIDPTMEAERFDKLQTWIVAIMLQNLPDLLAANKTLDEVLWERAAKASKITAAMEKFADHAAMFDAMGEDVQVHMLAGALAGLEACRNQGMDPTRAMIDIYSSGDMEQVEAEVKRMFREIAKAGGEKAAMAVRKGLLDDRNIKMAATIMENLRKEPGSIHFFAAGTAHFVSATGIGHLIEDAGYTVTRITE